MSKLSYKQLDQLGEFLYITIRWLIIIGLPLAFFTGFALRGCMYPSPN